MLNDIRALASKAQQPSRRIIGLMSGTSLDGLDIALCDVHGTGLATRVSLQHFTTVAYSDVYRDRVRAVFAKRQVDLQQVTLLNAWIGREHARMVQQALKAWGVSPETVDCIASHGQTIYHAPKHQHGLDEYPHATLQIGDGDHIAHLTGILTVSDFRQKHIAAGGEGAPLVKYGDYLLFADPTKTRILLNIGGIANLTCLPAGGSFSATLCGDVGPGNTLMDQYVQRSFSGRQYDQDALIASSGKVNNALLDVLKAHPFFSQPMPKTTGPELFNLDMVLEAQRRSQTESVPAEDVLATLNQLSADVIVAAIGTWMDEQPNRSVELFVSGGGLHNPLLMDTIARGLPNIEPCSTNELGLLPDAKEAALFALLANECIAGDATSYAAESNDSSVVLPISMGKISLPH